MAGGWDHNGSFYCARGQGDWLVLKEASPGTNQGVSAGGRIYTVAGKVCAHRAATASGRIEASTDIVN